MARRLAAPGIVALALLCSFGGLGGVASLLLLAAIVAGAVRLVEVVGLVAEGRGDRLAVAAAAAGLVCLVGAGATHVLWLAAGLFVCAAIEPLGRPEEVAEVPAGAVELRQAA